MSNLHEGDHVVLIKPDPDDGPSVGTHGTVIAIERRLVLVDWKTDEWDGGDYNDDHNILNGWWVPHECLERVDLEFYLVGIVDGKEVALDDTPSFATGKEAAEYAKSLTLALGHKVQPRRHAKDNDSWRQREQQRIDDGTYAPLPESWDLAAIQDHFLHRSKDEPEMVAYTSSPHMGVLDRQTRTTPGRYLAQFYPFMSQRERNRYIAMIDGGNGVLFAKTPDEIEAVYLGGVSSCMGHVISDYQSFVHPVRAYGDSDLQLAYLKDGTRITARALVWPEKMLIGRVYGDEARLVRALENAGYMMGPRLHGARIRKIWDERRKQYVVPYIDNCGMVWDPDQEDREGFLIIQSYGNVYAASTNGLGISHKFCPRSQNWVEPRVMRFVHGPNEEWSVNHCDDIRQIDYTDRNGDYHDEWWAEDYIEEIGGNYYPKGMVTEDDLVKSAYSGTMHPKWVMVEGPDGELITNVEFECYTGICMGNSKRYWSEQLQWVNGGRYSKEWIATHFDRQPVMRPTTFDWRLTEPGFIAVDSGPLTLNDTVFEIRRATPDFEIISLLSEPTS